MRGWERMRKGGGTSGLPAGLCSPAESAHRVPVAGRSHARPRQDAKWRGPLLGRSRAPPHARAAARATPDSRTAGGPLSSSVMKDTELEKL